jgi:hypothetical protein
VCHRLEFGGDGVEGAAQIGTDRAHNPDGRHGDQCGDETVFNRGCAVLILQQLYEECEDQRKTSKGGVGCSTLTIAPKNEGFLEDRG